MGGRFQAKKGQSWHKQRTHAPASERTSPDGVVHRTNAEKRRWNQLRLFEHAGHIRNLRRQVRYYLRWKDANGVEREILSETGKCCYYTADFVYDKRGAKFGSGEYQWNEIIEDLKGYFDREGHFRISVFEAIYGVKVFIYKETKSEKKAFDETMPKLL